MDDILSKDSCVETEKEQKKGREQRNLLADAEKRRAKFLREYKFKIAASEKRRSSYLCSITKRRFLRQWQQWGGINIQARNHDAFLLITPS